MLDVHQKRKLRAVMYNRITLGVLFVLVLFFLHSTWVVYQKKKTTEGLKEVSLRHKEELEVRDKELQSQIVRLNTAAGIEQEIRLKFNVAKPQENMVVVIDPPDTSASTATTSSPSFLRRIWNFLNK